jgi:hypothetical protein
MLFKDKIADYSEKHMKPIIMLCGQIAKLVIVVDCYCGVRHKTDTCLYYAHILNTSAHSIRTQ